MSLRLDRWASIHMGQTVSRLLRDGSRPRIPILMYHGIREASGEDPAYYQTNTSAEVFAQHMQFLRREGYSVVSLEEAVQSLSAGQVTGRAAVITFDDGYRNFYTTAFPILSEYGFTATVFLSTGQIQESRPSGEGGKFLVWPEVRELHARGVRFGSHTVTHPQLREMSHSSIRYEIASSKATLEEKLGNGVKSFSYPFAFPEGKTDFILFIREVLQTCGYECGVTTVIGTAHPNSDPYFLPRLPLNSWDDVRLLQAKLEGGYDWVHIPQLLRKLVQG